MYSNAFLKSFNYINYLNYMYMVFEVLDATRFASAI